MNKTAIGAGPSGQNKARARRLRNGAVAIAAICALAGGAALTLAVPASASTAPLAANQRQYGPLYNGISGQCLQDDGGPVSTAPCNGSPSQKWKVILSIFDGQNAGRYLNKATGQCLETDSSYGYYGNLYTLPCTHRADQKWVNLYISTDYGAMIQNAHTGLCLESDQYGNAYAQVCNIGNWQWWL